MTSIRPRTLSHKLLIVILPMIAAVIGLLVLYYTAHNRRTLEHFQHASGTSLVQSLGESARLGVVAKEPMFLDAAFDAAMANPQVVFIAAYDREGVLLDSRARVPIGLDLSDECLARVREAGAPYHCERTGRGKSEADNFFAPLFAERDLLYDEEMLLIDEEEDVELRAVGSVRVGLSREEILRSERRALLASGTIGGSALLAAILGSLLMVRRVTTPLKQLEEGARQIRAGRLEVELPVMGDDELASVADAFNAMARSLLDTTVSKDFMESVVDSMNEAMFVVDDERRITAVNEAARNLLEQSSDDIAGQSVDALFIDPSSHPLDSSGWDSLRLKAISNTEATFKTKKGSPIDINLSAAPLRDAEGRSLGAVVVARDMRELNELVASLRSHASELERYQSVLMSMLDDNERGRAETEAERMKLAAAVRSMTDGMMMFDRTGRLALINPAAAGMLEMKGEAIDSEGVSEALGGRFDDMISKGAAPDAGRTLHEITLGTRRRRVVMAEGIAIEHEGGRIGSMIVMRDITRQRELDEAKHELISNVSHELRTPLAIMSNVVSNALVGVSGEINEKLRRGLETCDTNAKRLAHIIDKLLQAASAEKGESRIERKLLDIRDIIRPCAAGFEARALAKGLKFSSTIPDEPLRAFVDSDALCGVIESLLSNALRFTERGSIKIKAAAKGGLAEISVVDSGVGIPIEDQASIFEAFSQIGRAYGPGEKGVGLGLALARRMVEQHGGSIHVASLPGKGTKFTVTIPLVEEDEETLPEQGG